MKQVKKFYLLFAACLFITGCINPTAHARLTIVHDGKSSFTIVVPAKAPASVILAAQELQRSIEDVTRAKLPIQNDKERINGQIISLGSTHQAQAAGISINGIADSGFRIVTKNHNLYIIGLDTAAKQHGLTRGDMDKLTPDPNVAGPQFTEGGGFSNGTANGIYTFLEDYLDVRWLIPGELGRDVPAKSTFTISHINRAEAPRFIFRSMTFLTIGADPSNAIYEWKLRQKLGTSININYEHNWMKTVPADLFKTHPDWFPLKDGKRIPPVGHYKLETTNPELVRYYADKAIAALKADPNRQTYSLSPSDGFGWSESPESTALYDPEARGVGQYPCITPLILKFYRDVAAIVQKEYPQGKLAGFIYNTYLSPPSSGNTRLPENFIPVLAPDMNYFYGLYSEDVRARFEHVITTWGKVAPTKWFIYDEPNLTYWLYMTGIITPPSTSILNYYFPLLVKNGIKGMTTSGSGVWSQAALANYIMAKLMWNPTLDADELQKEWLSRAYGPQAGAVMEEFYQKLDGWFAKLWRANRLTRFHMQDIYGANYPEMEKLLLQAKAQPMTEMQKRRFHLIEMNMAILQWRLEVAGYIPAGFVSKLQYSGAQIEDMLFDNFKIRRTQDNAFPLFPVAWNSGVPKRNPMPVKLNQMSVLKHGKDTTSTINDGYIQLYAKQAGEVNIKINRVDSGSAYVAYNLFPEGKGSQVRTGLCYTGANITFNARSHTLYMLHIGTHGLYQPRLEYNLSVTGATTATGTVQDGILYLQGKDAPLYVYTTGKLSLQNNADGVTISTESPANAARAVALQQNPGSKVLLTLDDKWHFQPDAEKQVLLHDITKLNYDDTSWKIVDATDTWNLQGFPNYHGTAWYRKTVTIPMTKAGQRLLLFFGGVEGDAVVYVNGQKVGKHLWNIVADSWEGSFELDVTNVMKPGKNILTVQVTKEDPAAGIHKGVSLLEVP